MKEFEYVVLDVDKDAVVVEYNGPSVGAVRFVGNGGRNHEHFSERRRVLRFHLVENAADLSQDVRIVDDYGSVNHLSVKETVSRLVAVFALGIDDDLIIWEFLGEFFGYSFQVSIEIIPFQPKSRIPSYVTKAPDG